MIEFLFSSLSVNNIFGKIKRLPKWINLSLLALNKNPYLIFGKKFKQYSKFLKNTNEKYCNTKLLLNTVNRAINEIPYYRKLYGDKKITSIKEFENNIKFIDKDTILQNYSDFINPLINYNNYDFGTTGGTSGRPLKLAAPKMRYIVELATMHSLWKSAGYNFNVRAVIRNKRLGANESYLVNPITREIIFDGFRLDDDYFEIIYKVIKKFNIRFIHCYPSVAFEFSTFLLNKEHDTSFIKAFLSSSENIFDYQVDLIQNRLGIRFYNWYGHSEKLILAGYCENTNIYHVEPTYGYFELIDENNRLISEPGKIGEIVGTGFHNPGMFFIRYRTGDFAEFGGNFCPFCKRHITLLNNIIGRWSGNKIYNKDGSFVTTTALNLHSNLYSVINGLQYFQEKKGELKVLVIKSTEYKEIHERELYKHFKTRLKADTVVRIQYVKKLIKQPNGKFLHIISKIDD